jgi:hypothetical protein
MASTRLASISTVKGFISMAVIAQATGRRTVIVDLNPQRSAAARWETRATETPEMVEATPGELRAVTGTNPVISDRESSIATPARAGI